MQGDERLSLRGVTYGTFRPGPDGTSFPEPEVVDQDLALMTQARIDSLRTYTVPPRWLLDLAAKRGLRVLVGVPWEGHVDFLGDRARARSIEDRVRKDVSSCAGHPALLGFAVGNEIPAGIVRWSGPRRIESFIERLYRAAKAEDPGALVTYANYPSTEYLRLDFLDLVCFNVFLEDVDELERYLGHLHTLAEDRPLVVSELGLDSLRHGTSAQARAVAAQLRVAFTAGCAGAFVFSWTDEWYRGGHDVQAWDFGLVDRERTPKPALGAAAEAFADAPFPVCDRRPRVSVVVCSYNGARTLPACLDSVRELDYPDAEVVIVDDGSTDETAAIAAASGFRLVSTPNRGLGGARNTGIEAATGEIVAFLDDDARPEPDWLSHLVAALERADGYAGVGGPNLPPADGRVAECVANAPGGPTHVLLPDLEAEHIPGCNMAFRRDCLTEIGGFDPQFRIAGDDVDVCWRLQQYGWRLGFSPAAVVWHRRRGTVGAFWRQQREYGRAEALLERKWPERYNALGHVSWAGRMYRQGRPRLLSRWWPRVRYGVWGSGAFQTLDEPRSSRLLPAAGMPEWYLAFVALACLGALGALWRPLLLALPAALLIVFGLVAQAAVGAAGARFRNPSGSRFGRTGMRVLTFALFLAQPLARLAGRLAYGLTPWRHRGPRRLALPLPLLRSTWSENWIAPEARIGALATRLREGGAAVRSGRAYDRWDLEVRGGQFGAARIRMAVEEHGSGRQLVRFRIWPRVSRVAGAVAIGFGALAAGAAVDGAPAAAVVLATTGALVVLLSTGGCAISTAALLGALEEPPERREKPRNGTMNGRPALDADLTRAVHGEAAEGSRAPAEVER